MKIFLEENRSVLSNNVENNLNIEFDTKNRLLPDESLVDNFSLYEQYVKERDECCDYRIILNINPLCSNVLFNTITEITIKEGSDYCKCLNFINNGVDKLTYAENAVNTTSPIKCYNAIQNTEYSHKENGNFSYHCGLDIFNNHMLRKKNFIHINKINTGKTENLISCGVYNTIKDYLRDNEGDIVKESLRIKHVMATESENPTPRHLYDTNSLYTLKNAFYEYCHNKDGWYGFTNPGMININTTSSSTLSTNEMLSNNKPCEFIDMYPDRSLYSFIPKFNENRRRAEKNWDYCITYPYSKDYDFIDEICGGENGAIKARIKIVTSSSGVRLLQCTSLFKHSLSVGSYVNFYYYMIKGGEKPTFVDDSNIIKPLKDAYYTQESTLADRVTREYDEDDLSFQRYQKDIRIYSVGDLNGENKDRIFSVKYDDIKKIYDNFAAFGCFYKKFVNNTECSYYARIFKKFKNKDGVDLLSDINKTAFAKNIYGDDIAQIVFTDNVNLCDITDENGRDISEIYFTVIKRNAGNTMWYKAKNTSNGSIEESHCFGTLTSGIDFSGVDVNEEPFDYNVHYLHNLDENVCYNSVTNTEDIPARRTFSAWGDTILAGMPKYIESGITINDDVFYGDIVEFDNYNYKVTTIANIMHRFNTMQRECFDLAFRDLKQDIIAYDDYDGANLESGFTVKSYFCNDTFTSMHEVGDTATTDNLMYSNIMPEGYFYNPHTPIKIKEDGDVLHSEAYHINYGKCSVSYIGGNVILNVEAPAEYSFIKGDYVAMYDKKNGEIVWGEIKSVSGYSVTVAMPMSSFYGVDIANHEEYFLPMNGERRYFMFWAKDSVPTYAKLCLDSKTFAWRNTLKMSELDKNSELFDMPFTNGCNYVQKNINFALRRQDPRGDYGLSYPKFKEHEITVFNVMTKYVIDGSDKVDLSTINYVNNKDLNICY